MEAREFERMLHVKLEPAEIQERGERLAAICETLERVDLEKKEKVKEYDTQIKGHKKEIALLSEMINRGTEERSVRVVDKPDLERACFVQYRTDTGEVVQERPMNPHELEAARQISFEG